MTHFFRTRILSDLLDDRVRRLRGIVRRRQQPLGEVEEGVAKGRQRLRIGEAQHDRGGEREPHEYSRHPTGDTCRQTKRPHGRIAPIATPAGRSSTKRVPGRQGRTAPTRAALPPEGSPAPPTPDTPHCLDL